MGQIMENLKEHQNKPTKQNLPNQTYQTTPTKPNLPNQALQAVKAI